ncbi:MAG: 23S rRNA (adenine(2503)-C(2))-methyltransferase RlmN [Desulfitobacteriaceae bacterium]|nr:23S rRNA (adenine(2503)-C(2))-methyltransferase RlmN [Desulfitobacteriaceae bacterium]
MKDLLGLDIKELEELVAGLGYPAFRAKQIFHWVQKKGAISFQEMVNLPKDMRDALDKKAFICSPQVSAQVKSVSGDTAKFLLKFKDGSSIETVLMTYDRDDSRDRNTVCLSTQVGCGMGCLFCATGISGMVRNLSAGEIVAQVWAAERYCQEKNLSNVTNIVYMGMGEPLANLPAVLKSIALLNHPEGLNIGMRRVTVSTCGLVPRIYQLADFNLGVTLAVSLHAAENTLRSRLMPVNKKFPIEDVLKAARYFSAKTGRRVTYEYILLSGVNDRENDARALGRLLQGHLANVNVIPANPVVETGFLRPRPQVVKKFAQILASCGVNAYIREEKGTDISAACGQLRRRLDNEGSGASV